MKKYFLNWLNDQIKRDDPIYDLASDVKRCPPRMQVDNLKDWRNHLRANGASEEALQTLEEAWIEYQEYLKS